MLYVVKFVIDKKIHHVPSNVTNKEVPASFELFQFGDFSFGNKTCSNISTMGIAPLS